MARQSGGKAARLEYRVVSVFLRMLRAVPLERSVRLGGWLGARAMELDRVNRPVAMRNLEIAFPELERAAWLRILRDSYRNWGRMLAEWTHSGELNRGNIEQYVTYENRQYLEAAAAMVPGRGVFVLTGHFGNTEWLALAHSIYGHRIAIVHRPLRNRQMDEQVRAVRASFGNRIIGRRGAGRTMLQLVRENTFVAVALDLDVRRGVFVDFFSLKASTSDGLARLAMLAGVPVLPVFMVREGGSPRHRITFLPPVELARCSDRETAVRENTQRFTSVIESMIRRHPDHWNWIHRRWKTRPPGEQRFY